MAKEIERKFLVSNDSYRSIAQSSYNIKQGYLSTRKEATVRIRLIGSHSFLTIKGLNTGATRDEWEYPIPINDAIEMLSKLTDSNIIDKTRYIIVHDGHTWEVDEFHGIHDGLVLAEIELKNENEPFTIPSFIGKEVTGDAAYYNSTLSGL